MAGRAGLLDQIQKGKKLKKAVTVDKSDPLRYIPKEGGGGGGGSAPKMPSRPSSGGGLQLPGAGGLKPPGGTSRPPPGLANRGPPAPPGHAGSLPESDLPPPPTDDDNNANAAADSPPPLPTSNDDTAAATTSGLLPSPPLPNDNNNTVAVAVPETAAPWGPAPLDHWALDAKTVVFGDEARIGNQPSMFRAVFFAKQKKRNSPTFSSKCAVYATGIGFDGTSVRLGLKYSGFEWIEQRVIFPADGKWGMALLNSSRALIVRGLLQGECADAERHRVGDGSTGPIVESFDNILSLASGEGYHRLAITSPFVAASYIVLHPSNSRAAVALRIRAAKETPDKSQSQRALTTNIAEVLRTFQKACVVVPPESNDIILCFGSKTQDGGCLAFLIPFDDDGECTVKAANQAGSRFVQDGDTRDVCAASVSPLGHVALLFGDAEWKVFSKDQVSAYVTGLLASKPAPMRAHYTCRSVPGKRVWEWDNAKLSEVNSDQVKAICKEHNHSYQSSSELTQLAVSASGAATFIHDGKWFVRAHHDWYLSALPDSMPPPPPPGPAPPPPDPAPAPLLPPPRVAAVPAPAPPGQPVPLAQPPAPPTGSGEPPAAPPAPPTGSGEPPAAPPGSGQPPAAPPAPPTPSAQSPTPKPSGSVGRGGGSGVAVPPTGSGKAPPNTAQPTGSPSTAASGGDLASQLQRDPSVKNMLEQQEARRLEEERKAEQRKQHQAIAGRRPAFEDSDDDYDASEWDD